MPRGYGESGKADISSQGALGSSSSQSNIGLTKKSHYQGREAVASDDILDDEEESMDWWTKYFASVDAMIEVNKLSDFNKSFVIKIVLCADGSHDLILKKFFNGVTSK